MAKQYYVAFDDSANDPTYTSSSDAYLVIADDSGYTNPCAADFAEWIPVHPNTPSEIRRFAEFQGWEIREENGKVVLVTDISSK